MPRRPISLCIITKNEERNLRRCIESVPFAEEIVVLDSGSTDGTERVARELGAKFHAEDFRGHSAQKARATELASHRWVLCLDADESLSPELAAEIDGVLNRADHDDAVGYELPRKNSYLGRYIEHSGWWPEYRLRLFDREAGGWGGRDPHDRVEVTGPVKRLQQPMLHDSYQSLSHHLTKVNSYTSIMARELLREGRRFRWSDLLFRPPVRFFKLYVLRRGFLDGGRGLLLAWIAAFYVFLKYAKMWEIRRSKDPSETFEEASGTATGSSASEKKR